MGGVSMRLTIGPRRADAAPSACRAAPRSPAATFRPDRRPVDTELGFGRDADWPTPPPSWWSQMILARRTTPSIRALKRTFAKRAHVE